MGSRSLARTVVSIRRRVLAARSDTMSFRGHLQANLSSTKRLVSALSLQRRSQVQFQSFFLPINLQRA